MRSLRSAVCPLIVRMLWRRSPSLMSTTRTSSAMATSILRMFSAWCASALLTWILPSLVTPSTSFATWSPNSAAHLLASHLGVLDRVVQERGHERLRVEPQVGEDAGHGEGMLDVRLARQPGLPGMRAIGDLEGTVDGGPILRREVVDTSHELGDRHGL